MFASSEYMSLIYKNYNDQINNYLIKENFTIKITCLIILIPRYLYQVFLMEVIYLMIIFLKKKFKFDDNSILKINNVDNIFKKNDIIRNILFVTSILLILQILKNFVTTKNLSFVTGLGINFIEAIMYHTF